MLVHDDYFPNPNLWWCAPWCPSLCRRLASSVAPGRLLTPNYSPHHESNINPYKSYIFLYNHACFQCYFQQLPYVHLPIGIQSWIIPNDHMPKVNNLLLASKKHESYNQKKGQSLAVQFYLNIHFLLQRFYTNYQKQVDSICRLKKKRNQKQHQHLRTSPVPSPSRKQRGVQIHRSQARCLAGAQKGIRMIRKNMVLRQNGIQISSLHCLKTYVCFDII